MYIEINQAHALHAGDAAKVKNKLSHTKHAHWYLAIWVINVTMFIFVLSYKVLICKKNCIFSNSIYQKFYCSIVGFLLANKYSLYIKKISI